MADLKTILRGVLTLSPDAPAIEYERQWSSWRNVSSAIDAFDATLHERGISAGTRVGAVLRNTPEMASFLVGTVLSDRCVATLNPVLPDERLAADIRALKAPVIAALARDWERPSIRAAAEQAGALGVSFTGDPAAPVSVLFEQRSEDFRSEAAGIGIEMLTSGTTGTPKRIPLKARNFERMVLDAAVFESRSIDDPPQLRSGVSIVNTPFAHIGGIFSLFICFSAGRKACLLDRFSVDAFVDAVMRHRPKTVSAPPSALRMILDANVPPSALSSLVVFRTGTAPLDPDLADAFHARYGVPVLQNYGATEFAGGVAGWTLQDFRKYGASKRGSVGRLNATIEGRIVDQQSGDPLSAGEEGLLELRAQHLGDGAWMRTTDIARMDEDGFLWILGRADNAIIRGGFKVIPDDVVRAIESHPAVREACVVALPDPRLGQIPAAAFILKSGATLDEDALRDYLRARLTPYQVPARLLRLAEFPRTPSMKVSQPDLKKLFESAA